MTHVSTRCTFPRCHWHWQGTEAEGAAEFSTHRRMAHLYAGFYAYSTVTTISTPSKPAPKRVAMMRVTNAEILVRLRDEAAIVGGPLSIQAWQDSRRRPGSSSIIKRFGSWNAALSAAGLEVRCGWVGGVNEEQARQAQGAVVYVVTAYPEWGIVDIDSVWLSLSEAELRRDELDHSDIGVFMLNTKDGYLPGVQA